MPKDYVPSYVELGGGLTIDEVRLHYICDAILAEHPDAVLEQRLMQSGYAALARHVSNLTLRSDRSGVRPELELASPGAFVNGAVAAMIAYERAAELAAELAAVPVRTAMMAWA